MSTLKESIIHDEPVWPYSSYILVSVTEQQLKTREGVVEEGGKF